MIDPCPECSKVPEPVKAEYEAWSITCCGLSVVNPWFVGVLTAWRNNVDFYKRNKEWRESHELKL